MLVSTANMLFHDASVTASSISWSDSGGLSCNNIQPYPRSRVEGIKEALSKSTPLEVFSIFEARAGVPATMFADLGGKDDLTPG